MDLRAYVLGLFTIISGLAVKEIAERGARLVEFRRHIVWDYRPLITSGVMLCTIAVAWSRGWYQLSNAGDYHPSFIGFLVTLIAYILLYVNAAVTLPAEIKPGLNMKVFYREQGQEFWLIYVLTLAHFIVKNFGGAVIRDGGVRPDLILPLAAAGVILALSISLAALNSRRWHAIGGGLVLALLILPNLFRPF